MAQRPWVTIIGLGEDGPDGLSTASLAALRDAEIVMGPARHLGLLPDLDCETCEWPAPFADGIDQLLGLRGRQVAVLTSGDPFWFGAGSVLARHLGSSEWRAFPGPSCFALAASRLGWPLEHALCMGLHAAPLSRLRPHLAPGARLIVTLRDGMAPAGLAAYLDAQGFGDSRLHVMQALGGPRETIDTGCARDLTDARNFTHPVCVAMDIDGPGPALPRAHGLADAWFDHDGQITKRRIRALTLSTLAPSAGEYLWDIGGGSGSVAIEWLLAHPAMQATTIEADATRAARITGNAARLGVDHLNVVTGRAPDTLDDLPPPDAVFVGGGLSENMLDQLCIRASGARLVANAVTLETEALLIGAHARLGGELTRITLSDAAPIGPKRGWKTPYPIVQWSVQL